MIEYHTQQTRAGMKVFVHAPWGTHYYAGIVIDLGEDGTEFWGGRWMGNAGQAGMPGGRRRWSQSRHDMVRWLVRRWEFRNPEEPVRVSSTTPESRERFWRRFHPVRQELRLARLEVEYASSTSLHFPRIARR